MVPPDDMLATILVCIDKGIFRPAIWPLLWMKAIMPRDGWWAPLIRQMAPYLKQHAPHFWAGARQHLDKWRPDDLQKLEDGPVLSPEQIFEITARNIPALLVVLDSNRDPDDRQRAYEDLRSAGLLEAAA
jgi:hypothetical protein